MDKHTTRCYQSEKAILKREKATNSERENI